MDEQEIVDRDLTEAYARLGTALAPPSDVAVRVEREVGARRRRRRVAAGGIAALVVTGVVGGAVVLGSGDDHEGAQVATDPPSGPRGDFVLTRADGSTYEFDDLSLSCEKTAVGEAGEPGHIYLYSPFRPDASGEALTEPFLDFEARVDRADGRTFTLPADSVSGDSDDRAFVLFVAESDPSGGRRANEVSSAEPGAAGTVTVIRASCDPEPVLELEVDTTLGSEVEQGTLDLAGSFG